MEYELFEKIRDSLCANHAGVSVGTMMGSPAIHYRKKVFAFFSRSNTMVFKLGKDFPMKGHEMEIREFNPFKKKGPLRGWFELEYRYHTSWEELAGKALEVITLDLKK